MTAATAMLTMLLWIESASTPASLSLRTTDAIQSDAATSTALKWSPAMMPVTYDAKTMAAFVVKTSPLTADESVVEAAPAYFSRTAEPVSYTHLTLPTKA